VCVWAGCGWEAGGSRGRAGGSGGIRGVGRRAGFAECALRACGSGRGQSTLPP
jgi:hypothetical protein